MALEEKEKQQWHEHERALIQKDRTIQQSLQNICEGTYHPELNKKDTFFYFQVVVHLCLFESFIGDLLRVILLYCCPEILISLNDVKRNACETPQGYKKRMQDARAKLLNQWLMRPVRHFRYTKISLTPSMPTTLIRALCNGHRPDKFSWNVASQTFYQGQIVDSDDLRHLFDEYKDVFLFRYDRSCQQYFADSDHRYYLKRCSDILNDKRIGSEDKLYNLSHLMYECFGSWYAYTFIANCKMSEKRPSELTDDSSWGRVIFFLYCSRAGEVKESHYKKLIIYLFNS